MSNLAICFISVLVVIINASLTLAITQENSSMDNISNMTLNNTVLNNTLLNNTTPGNTSLIAPATSNILVNLAKPKGIETVNDISANTSIKVSTAQPKQSDEDTFVIGSGAISNESSLNVDVPASPAKNASNLWYVIQAKPHGMV